MVVNGTRSVFLVSRSSHFWTNLALVPHGPVTISSRTRGSVFADHCAYFVFFQTRMSTVKPLFSFPTHLNNTFGKAKLILRISMTVFLKYDQQLMLRGNVMVTPQSSIPQILILLPLCLNERFVLKNYLWGLLLFEVFGS